jgi:hypothetical protein
MADRLEKLLPELEYSRKTHVQWRDAPAHWHTENPDIGDPAYHASCIVDYDTRISTIKEAAALLRLHFQNK